MQRGMQRGKRYEGMRGSGMDERDARMNGRMGGMVVISRDMVEERKGETWCMFQGSRQGRTIKRGGGC